MKIKKPSAGRKHIFISWLVSYFIVISICVFFSIIVYAQARKIMESEINNSSRVLAEQMRQSIDQRLEDIKQLAVQISLDKNLQDLFYISNPMSNYDYYKEKQTAEDFALLKSGNNYVDFFYVWISGIGTHPASNGTYSSDILFDTYFSGCGMTYDEWEEAQGQTYAGTFLHIGGNSDSSTIVYMKSAIYNDKNYKVTVSVLFDKDKLLNALQNVDFGNESTVGVIDGDGTILTSTSPDISGIRYDLLTKPEGISYQTLGERPMAVSYIKSGVSDWIFVNAVPVSVYQEKLEQIRLFTFLCVFVSLIVSGLIAYFITRRNYHPVKDILDYVTDVKKHENRGQECGGNEFSFIRDFIKSTQKEKDEYFKGWEQHRLALRDNFLIRLIKGETNPDLSMEEILASYKINFTTDQFGILLFSAEEYDNLADEKAFDGLHMAHYAICNVAEEIALQKNDCFVVQCDDMVVCLLNFRKRDKKENSGEMGRIAEECKTFFEEKLEICVTIAISLVHTGYPGIQKAYNETAEAMEYRIVLGNGGIIPYEMITPSQSKYLNFLPLEKKLINAIKTGDSESARNILTEAFTLINTRELPSVDVARCFMFGLVNTMMQALSEMGDLGNEDFLSHSNTIEILLNCRDLGSLKLKMDHLLVEICEYISKTKEKSGNELFKNKILSYVQKNYNDSNLNISGMANSLNVNPIYLSKFFKEQTEETLLDYINHIRLDKAKRLIEGTNQTINEIAVKVGYYNSNSFIRVFKKYEGITPGKFRETFHNVSI